MKPKFPGMNPYLENPELWSEVHFGIIATLARSLNARLTPRYRAAVEKRVYADSLLVGIPDVAVMQRNDPKPQQSSATQVSATQVSATQVLTLPVKVNTPIAEEVREYSLDIRQVGTGRVVTVIEVLSPKNKRPGEGREQYQTKRRAVLASTSHLIEIDLLRIGEPQPCSETLPSDYRILISRSNRRPEADLYPFNMRDSIPLFSLPLQAGDEEPAIDLQDILNQVYDDAALALAIDYTQPPSPAITDADWQWMQKLALQ